MTDRCDSEIFSQGLGIVTFAAPAIITEPWVQKVAVESGQRVDWHYSGGRVNVLYIGDYEIVRAAVERLKPELDAACNADALVRYPDIYNQNYPPNGANGWRVFDPESHGLYRAGDPIV